jgi:signal transduction histidine kinase
MTRRIALAILLSAWAVVLIALVVIYLTTRQTLLAELDESIIMRASALPHLLGVSRESSMVALPPGDRYLIRNELGQVMARPDGQLSDRTSPVVTNRKFISMAGGGRLRSITLNFGVRSSEGAPERLATIVYSAPASSVDALLRRLTLLLCIVGLGGALLIGAVAMFVSRAALRPLRQTSEVIGTINEKKLDRRVDAAALPKELRPMAERLNEMLARLEREFVQRKQFLADTAHELRTPVAAILTHLEVTLRRPREPAALADALRTSLSDVQMLRRLVDALLEQVRSDRGLVPADAQWLDLSALLEQCATLADSPASEKNVKVIRKFGPGMRVQTHAAVLQSIVTNLLSNAVEYSRAGGVIEFDCQVNGRQLELSVRDEGPGIAADVLPHIFQAFYRADSSRGSNRGHLGLGLFLVQSHAQSLGGRCEAESTPGTGSVFRVWLPTSPPEAGPDASATVEHGTAAHDVPADAEDRFALDAGS